MPVSLQSYQYTDTQTFNFTKTFNCTQTFLVSAFGGVLALLRCTHLKACSRWWRTSCGKPSLPLLGRVLSTFHPGQCHLLLATLASEICILGIDGWKGACAQCICNLAFADVAQVSKSTLFRRLLKGNHFCKGTDW